MVNLMDCEQKNGLEIDVTPLIRFPHNGMAVTLVKLKAGNEVLSWM